MRTALKIGGGLVYLAAASFIAWSYGVAWPYFLAVGPIGGLLVVVLVVAVIVGMAWLYRTIALILHRPFRAAITTEDGTPRGR